ncbi:DUF3422 family protein [Aureimonas pseudogalii]|uniref:Putative membrane-anchored protein n=1 Tax=Aureimonas pseudogalii TaxID=1744844 RepID=A0A7W6H919_9HYPH|nr:DUF3422 domain-containing protein [Aureimonas pseudogalii]MBB4000661.1 putative membrane-anchored protein [Aureimonas pseudogalii]
MSNSGFGEQRFPAFKPDPRRALALGELHARPFPRIIAPRQVIALAFTMTDDGERDFETLSALSTRCGIAPPAFGARAHVFAFGQGTLRWERHSEFSTYLFEGPAPGHIAQTGSGHPFGADFAAPGPLIAGVHLEIWSAETETGIGNGSTGAANFEEASLCHSTMEGGLAEALTDFRQDGDGLTHILVLDRGLAPHRAGALVLRLVEIEIYRTLALLGLPLAQETAPRLRRLEAKLADITREMDRGSEDSRSLLHEITAAAAEVEAGVAAVLYRFGASRAYDEIVRERLLAVGDTAMAGRESWSAFLKRRMAPAMRTCRSVEQRQANLSEKLARAANLLRTRIDVELEHQNRDLLHQMNRRAQLQLRLQQTVEGLSVAAIAYYVVGLFGYLAKGAFHEGGLVDPSLLVASFVPIAVAGVWLTVRRIRGQHGDTDEHVAPKG